MLGEFFNYWLFEFIYLKNNFFGQGWKVFCQNMVVIVIGVYDCFGDFGDFFQVGDGYGDFDVVVFFLVFVGYGLFCF